MYPEKRTVIEFNSHLLNEFLTEWQKCKKDLADRIISKAEYA